MLALYQSLHKSPHGIIRLSRCLSQVLAPQTSEPAQTVLTSESSETASKRRKLPMERQEKSKLYLTEYREKNRERLRQYANAYNKEHKELRAMVSTCWSFGFGFGSEESWMKWRIDSGSIKSRVWGSGSFHFSGVQGENLH